MGIGRIEVGPRPGQVRVVPCDDAWIAEVAALSGMARRRAIEPTLRGYIACRMQRAKLLGPTVPAAPEDEEMLRAAVEALQGIPWDPGTNAEIRTALSQGWEKTLTGHQATSLRMAVNRCFLGAGRMGIAGTASTSGPEGSREKDLED